MNLKKRREKDEFLKKIGGGVKKQTSNKTKQNTHAKITTNTKKKITLNFFQVAIQFFDCHCWSTFFSNSKNYSHQF